MENKLARISENIKQCSIVVDAFAESVVSPIMYDSNEKHFGIRYMKPTEKHFCILKAVRAVSGLNAAVVLAKNGFNQEVCVLIRTIVECHTQIEFVLAGFNGDNLAKKQQDFVDKFFQDYQRNNSKDYISPKIRQKEIHNEVGRNLESSRVTGDIAKPPSELMSNVYRVFSGYVHAYYPEVMDMYGGIPTHFHMEGMSRTRKDDESIEIIGTVADSVSITLGLMIQKFRMSDTLSKISELKHWFNHNSQLA